MNTEQAWDHFVRQVVNVAGGIEEPTRAIAAGKLYAAACVTEARAPLVKVLRAIERKVECPLCGEAIGCGHAPDCQLAAALAKGEDE